MKTTLTLPSLASQCDLRLADSLVPGWRLHTPRTAFRHLHPRKDVVNQCLKFVETVVGNKTKTKQKLEEEAGMPFWVTNIIKPIIQVHI